MAHADLDGVMAVETVSYLTPWSRRLFEEEIGREFSDAIVAVTAREGDVLGFAVCWTVADQSHLLNIAVRPDARGRGIGTALLRECCRRGAEAGAERIYLEVRAGNAEAVRLYRREGFVAEGIREKYYTDTGEDAIVMSKMLPDGR
jgi:ribosomal-protein-alanine N-acetyltransferase